MGQIKIAIYDLFHYPALIDNRNRNLKAFISPEVSSLNQEMDDLSEFGNLDNIDRI